MAERSRSFAPTALTGVAAAALAAISSHQDWARADTRGGAGAPGSDVAPAALALALVALAAWGVLLVVRRRARRAMAVLGALADLGVAAVVLASSADARAAAVAAQAGISLQDVGAASLTGWYAVTAAAALVSAACFAVAVGLAGRWPEMGRRYDAPGPAPTAAPAAAPTAGQDAWRALDEGRDPTA